MVQHLTLSIVMHHRDRLEMELTVSFLIEAMFPWPRRVPALHALIGLLEKASTLLTLQQLRPAALMNLHDRLGWRCNDLLAHELLVMGWRRCSGGLHHHF